jgi:hypothetical protein
LIRNESLAGGDSLEGRSDLVRERLELVVDDEEAVGPGGDADVSARALEHPDVPGHLRRLDLDLREPVVLRPRGQDGDSHRTGPQHKPGHPNLRFG